MKQGKARLLALLAGIAAVMLAAGAALMPWWTGPSVKVFLVRMSLCGEGRCVDRGLDGFGGAGAWPDLALATAAAAIAAALVLLVVAAALAFGKKLNTLNWGAGVLSMFCAVLGALVIVLRPAIEGLFPAYGMAMTLSGAVLAIAVSFLLGRSK